MVRPEAGAPAVKMVRVTPAQVLATVGGVQLTLKDLMPLPASKTETPQLMSAEMFSFLLNRAVEREATIQAAAREGVELTAPQRQKLQEARARAQEAQAGVFDTVQQDPANAEFEQKDSAALLLQASLAEKAGVPSPHVTAQLVQAYYQQHEAEYGLLPSEPAARQAAWQRIDAEIRLKLAPQVQAQYEQNFKQFIEQLKAAAEINIQPTS